MARKYGWCEVRFISRQGIEIPRVRFCDIEAARKELAEAGLALGPCGPHFRTVSACPNGCSKPLENELVARAASEIRKQDSGAGRQAGRTAVKINSAASTYPF